MAKPTHKIDNFWLDLDKEIKFSILDKAVEYGYLKKEFIEDMKKAETEDMYVCKRYPVSRKNRLSR